MLGAVFPLITNAMFTRLTFAGACSLLGGVVSLPFPPSYHLSPPYPKQPHLTSLSTFQGALLTIVPWVLVFYGPKIRARSKFASVCTSFCLSALLMLLLLLLLLLVLLLLLLLLLL